MRGFNLTRFAPDGRFAVRIEGDMLRHYPDTDRLEIDGVRIALVSGKAQLLDREMLRMVGIQPEAMRIIVCKSSNHFRADFTPIASRVLVAKAAGPMAADPADLPWRKLPTSTRRSP